MEQKRLHPTYCNEATAENTILETNWISFLYLNALVYTAIEVAINTSDFQLPGVSTVSSRCPQISTTPLQWPWWSHRGQLGGHGTSRRAASRCVAVQQRLSQRSDFGGEMWGWKSGGAGSRKELHGTSWNYRPETSKGRSANGCT